MFEYVKGVFYMMQISAGNENNKSYRPDEEHFRSNKGPSDAERIKREISFKRNNLLNEEVLIEGEYESTGRMMNDEQETVGRDQGPTNSYSIG